MSEIKFACPSCQQHIQCDTSYGGMQIDCPACHAKMIVPGDPPVPSPAPPPPPAGHSCPECNSPLSPAAVMCTNCGFNLRTGQRMPAQAPPPAGAKKKKKKKRRAADPHEEKWYASPWPYVGVIALVFLGLFFAAKSSELAAFAYVLLALLCCFGVHISVVVHAFKNEGAGWAFLCFCLGPVELYYVYKRSESQLLQTFYTVAIALGISLIFLDFNTLEENYDAGGEIETEMIDEMPTIDVDQESQP